MSSGRNSEARRFLGEIRASAEREAVGDRDHFVAPEREYELDARFLAHSPTGSRSKAPRRPGVGYSPKDPGAPGVDHSDRGDPWLSLAVHQMASRGSIDSAAPVASEMLGGTFAKSVLGKLMSWYVKYVAAQAAEFNAMTTQALTAMARRLESLEGALDALQPIDGSELVEVKDEGGWWGDIAVGALAGKRGRVLHVACGSGWLVGRLKGAGIDAYGIDPNERFDSEAAEQLDLRVEATMDHLGAVENASLAAAIISHTCESMSPSDCVSLAGMAARSISPGGAVFLRSMGSDEWEGQLGGVAADLSPGRPMKPATWQYLFSRYGFEVSVHLGPNPDPNGPGGPSGGYLIQAVKIAEPAQ